MSDPPSIKPSDMAKRAKAADQLIASQIAALQAKRVEYLERRDQLQTEKQRIEEEAYLRKKAIKDEHAARKRIERYRKQGEIRDFYIGNLEGERQRLMSIFGPQIREETNQEEYMTRLLTELGPELDVRLERFTKDYIAVLKTYKANKIPIVYRDNADGSKSLEIPVFLVDKVPEAKEVTDYYVSSNGKYNKALKEYNEVRALLNPENDALLKQTWAEIEEYQNKYAKARKAIDDDYTKWVNSDGEDSYRTWKTRDWMENSNDLFSAVEAEYEQASGAIDAEVNAVNNEIEQTREAEAEIKRNAKELITSSQLFGKGTTMTHRQNFLRANDLRQNKGGASNLKLVSIHPSTAKGKKYVVVLQEGDKEHTVQFGAKGYQDFTQHNDDAKKRRYLSRHKKREDWTNPLTAGFWSRWVLWNLPTLKDSIEDVRKRFNL